MAAATGRSVQIPEVGEEDEDGDGQKNSGERQHEGRLQPAGRPCRTRVCHEALLGSHPAGRDGRPAS